MALTLAQIKSALLLCGASEKETEELEYLPQYEKLGLTNLNRLACLVGQCAHESGGFIRFEENLNYSTDRLMQVWPSRFPNKAMAAPYGNNPIKIAEKVYGGRMGNTQPQDGWKYRGRGCLMLTGRDNYSKFDLATGTGVVDNPDLLRDDFNVNFLSALWFFSTVKRDKKTLFEWADGLSVKPITRAVNGGLIGLADRRCFTTMVLQQNQSPFSDNAVLKAGERGLPVRQFQSKLVDLKYLVRADGVYGNGTTKAVKQFQKDQGLTVDGTVGTQTYQRLKTLTC